jgi:hypothetical protein
VPQWPSCPKKAQQTAQSPGIRGFGVFGFQILFSEVEVSGVGAVPDAGSCCIEAVHACETL